jgi:hypothetical protein
VRKHVALPGFLFRFRSVVANGTVLALA